MTKQQYIQSVCLENDLGNTISRFLSSGEDQYHADRHVSNPPVGLSSFAACEAALALLQNWTAGVADAKQFGLFTTSPIVMIDDEWLAEKLYAPPPHVLLSLFKTCSSCVDQPIAGVRVAPDSSPFEDMLRESHVHASVYRLEPNEDFPDSGAWVIQLEVLPPISD
jgi:hypothetical protein